MPKLSKKAYILVVIAFLVLISGCKKSSSPKAPDKIPPTGAVSIDNGASCVNSNIVTLTLNAEDNPGGDGLSQMRFSADNLSWTTPQAYSQTRSWTFSAGDGAKIVYTQFSDKAGNWSQTYSATAVVDTVPPALDISSPKDGEVVK